MPNYTMSVFRIKGAILDIVFGTIEIKFNVKFIQRDG
jgi:hypothetical protein